MCERTLLLKKLQQVWNRRSIVWLSGVRRVGKTTPAHRQGSYRGHADCPCDSFAKAVSWGGKREIVSRPKCYAFDTGFLTFEKGWDSIRDDDRRHGCVSPTVSGRR